MKIFAALVTGTLLLATTGALWADEGQDRNSKTGFYLSLTPSAVWPFSVDTSSPSLSPGNIETKWGASIEGGVGYRCGDFRIEGEVMYGRSDADHVTFSGGGGDLSGYFDMWGATVNFFYDFPTGTSLKPYVGFGLGGIRLTAHDITLSGFPPTRGDNTLFTYKFMAGVSYALTDAWRLFLGYRFLSMGEQDYETGGIPLHGQDIETHAVQMGLQFYF